MNSKGFTTIELIVAILIAGIIMGAVGTFLTFNLRGFNTTTDIIDIQYEGQLVMNQLVDLVRESEGFTGITGSTIASPTVENKKDATYEIIPDVIKFEHSEWDSIHNTETRTAFELTYDQGSAILENYTVYESGSDVTYDMGRYITYFSLEPVDNDFEETDNVIIRLVLEQGGAIVNIESQVKIRNKH